MDGPVALNPVAADKARTLSASTGGASAKEQQYTFVGQSRPAAGELPLFAFRAAGQDGFAMREVAPPLAASDGGNAGVPVCMAHGQASAEIVRNGSPTLSCNHEAPIVCHIDGGDTARTLSARHDGSPCHDRGPDVVAVAFPQNMSATQCASTVDLAPVLQSHNPTAVATGYAVRRLTPRECERLQGFSDDYTLIQFRGKPAADGPRYRALGNSMAVTEMCWLGWRIEMVDTL
jgi:site-specific DNA-cytosine methylase